MHTYRQRNRELGQLGPDVEDLELVPWLAQGGQHQLRLAAEADPPSTLRVHSSHLHWPAETVSNFHSVKFNQNQTLIIKYKKYPFLASIVVAKVK